MKKKKNIFNKKKKKKEEEEEKEKEWCYLFSTYNYQILEKLPKVLHFE